jgi:uncharacterized membrane protein YqjE
MSLPSLPAVRRPPLSSRRSQRFASSLETRSGGGESFAANGAAATTAATTAWNPPAQDPSHRPLTQVLQNVAEESKALIGEELQLAGSELASKAKVAGKGAGLLGAAAVAAIFGAMALTAAIILALALVMPAWAAALVVAAAYLVIAGLLALTGRKQLQAASPLVPERAVRSLTDVVQKVQSAWKRGESRP